MAGIKIGILAKNDQRTGLWRDAECLLWALQQEALRPSGQHPTFVSLYPVSDLRSLGRDPYRARATLVEGGGHEAIPPGTLYPDWLQMLDVMIVSETLLPRAFDLAKQRGIKVVFIPNLDWAVMQGQVDHWVATVIKSECQVWAKTQKIAETLHAVGLQPELVPWSIPDPVVRTRTVNPTGDVTFLMNAGMGGWRNRRGVDIAIKAFVLVRRRLDRVRLLIKSILPLNYVHMPELLKTPGIEVTEGLISRNRLADLYQSSDAFLYPSRWEGFGLSLLEGLHAGLPAIATDGWPMNEMVEDGHNGLLIKARQVGLTHLAPHWECDLEAFVSQITRFASEPELRQQLTCPDPAALMNRQHNFALRVNQLLMAVKPPSVTQRQNQSMIELWDQRAKHRKHRAVGYYSWSEDRFQSETQRWWDCLSGHYLHEATKRDRLILDFGCGVGRFTSRLASMGFEVVGVDVSTEMLQWAKQSRKLGTEFIRINLGGTLPFSDGAFHSLWICTVLQHIQEGHVFTQTIQNLRRVLRKNALLLVCENTEQSRGRTSRTGHVVFRKPEEYLACFPGLTVTDEFLVEGERHTVFAGRLT